MKEFKLLKNKYYSSQSKQVDMDCKHCGRTKLNKCCLQEFHVAIIAELNPKLMH